MAIFSQAICYTKYIQALEEIRTEGGDHVLESLCHTKICRKERKTQSQIIQKRLYNHNLTKTDKGGVIVIVYVDDYVQEASQQLDNKDFYKKLTIDTTKSSRIKVNGTINEIKSSHLLDEKITNDLLSLEAKTPQFKMLPKFI